MNEDFDFEDDSDEHQDYEANYFDNGEGDDDSGGDSGTQYLLLMSFSFSFVSKAHDAVY